MWCLFFLKNRTINAKTG